MDTAILELLSEPVAAPQERAELLWDLNSLLEELPPRCRKLLQLRYGLGYDSAEVAEKMGYHPSSVRKVARRCMAALTYQMVTRGFTKIRLPKATASGRIASLSRLLFPLLQRPLRPPADPAQDRHLPAVRRRPGGEPAQVAEHALEGVVAVEADPRAGRPRHGRRGRRSPPAVAGGSGWPTGRAAAARPVDLIQLVGRGSAPPGRG